LENFQEINMKTNLSIALAIAVGMTTASPSLAGSMYRLTDLGKLAIDGTDTRAAGINNQGQIVGRSRVGSGTPSSGYIWENGTMTALPMTGTLNGSEIVTMPGRGGLSRSINEAGIIVGTGDQLPRATDRGMLWTPNSSGGYDLAIYDFGGVESYFIDINNNNEIAGYHIFAAGKRNAIFWQNGTRIDLPNLGGDQNFALAINDGTTIAGYVDTDGADNGTNTYSATIWQKDAGGNFVLTDLGTSGFNQSFARDINAIGQVIGQLTNGTGTDLTSSPFLWNGGSFTQLGSLGGARGDALSINLAGQIVGVSNDASGTARATLWQDGQVFDLNALVTNGTGWTLSQATGINDRGQIIGYGTFTSSPGQTETRAFVLETVPESDLTMAIVAIGGLGLLSGKLRRK
jgi:probable HAF family extracellular repeat protein